MSIAGTSTMRRALVVDDVDVNRLLAARLLAKSGWSVGEAVDAADAMKWMDGKELDLILLDISMPQMSGRELCKIIRRDHLGGAAVKIIAYTAHAMPEDTSSFIDDGFDWVLIKPIARKSLYDALAAVGFAP